MNTFNDFWDAYDNKKSRDKCERKWHLMTAKDQTECMDSLPSYIKETPDRTYRKHPITYLNQKCWNDKIYSKGEETVLYKTPEDKPLSDYEPKPYDRAKGIQNMRDKLKRNFENGGFIRDWGNIYTTLLRDKCGMVVSEHLEKRIKETLLAPRVTEFEHDGKVYEIKDRPKTTVSDSDVRDALLNHFLKECRESGRKIYEEI